MAGIDQFFLGDDAGDEAQSLAALRVKMLADDEPERTAEPETDPVVRVRWRRHDGEWQRWSELDGRFVAIAPPASLLELDDAGGVPGDDVELVLVDGVWEPAD
jgi:hypothetical protein